MSSSQYIYGIHDPGGEHLLNGRGWVVFTETADSQPGDYRRYVDQGLGVIVRLNHGYGKGTGTIPTPDRYAEFAKKCAAWADASHGIEWLTIGNEIALEWEWPTDHPVSLATYLDCYRQCYAAIKAVAPHAKIAPQAVAPWNASTPDASDWILQLRFMLLALDGLADWINLHAYTRGYGLDSFTSGERMNPPWQTHYSGWETLYQFMHVVPDHMRHLPVMVTETNGNAPWLQYQAGWVQSLYEQIERWNAKPGAQQIRTACIFRWAPHDSQWDISQCVQAHADLRSAITKGYQWRDVRPQVSPQPNAWTGYVIAPDGLNLRRLPTTGSDILRMLKFGDELTVYGSAGDWLTVQHEQATGYVAAQWVSREKPGISGGSAEDQRNDFDKAIDFVLRWEGGLADHEADPGGLTNFGISQRSYPDLDIRNLTREQAVEIYRRDYWQVSGADKLPWPLALIHMDSAVNAGVGRAQRWLEQSGSNPISYMALRLDFYTRLDTWQHFGLAWSRRIADLMRMVGK